MALALLLLACAYEVPADPDAPAVLNVLSGTVFVTGTDVVADTIMVLYDANNPPPPAGTGRPVSFATVPASTYTAADAGGLRAAPWALTDVPDGEWLVSALMDVDANFNPITTSNSGSTCGDWVGAYFADISTGVSATIPVSGGVRLDGLTVAIGREVATQRPAFEIVVSETTSDTIQATFGSPFQLASIGVHSEVYELAGPFDGTEMCDTAFWTFATDTDGDGAADPHPNENFAAVGTKDYWPRVYLRYNGETPAGEYYASEALPLAAAFGVGLPPVNTPTPITTFDLLFPGKAIHVYADGTEEVLEGEAIPRGEWSITVVQFTGQTWTLPNVLAAYPATDPSFDPAGQAAVLTIE